MRLQPTGQPEPRTDGPGALAPYIAASLPAFTSLAALGGLGVFMCCSILMVVATGALLLRDHRALQRTGEAPNIEFAGFLPTYALAAPQYLYRRGRLTGTAKTAPMLWAAAFAVWIAAATLAS